MGRADETLWILDDDPIEASVRTDAETEERLPGGPTRLALGKGVRPFRAGFPRTDKIKVERIPGRCVCAAAQEEPSTPRLHVQARRSIHRGTVRSMVVEESLTTCDDESTEPAGLVAHHRQ